jgi:hypothetical protein
VKGLSRETRLLLDRGRGETLEPDHRARLKRSVFARAFGVSAAATTLTAGWTATAAKLAAALMVVGGATALVAVGTGTRGARSDAPIVQGTAPAQAAEHPRTPSLAVDPTHVQPPGHPPAAEPAAGPELHEASRVTPSAAATNATARALATGPGSNHAAPAEVRTDPDTSARATASLVTEPSVASSLQEEALLVREANAAIESGDAVRSLALAEEHARRFSNGSLVPEGSAVHILALCQAGRLDQARTETAAFLLAHPEGPLSMRVRSSCGGAKP